MDKDNVTEETKTEETETEAVVEEKARFVSSEDLEKIRNARANLGFMTMQLEKVTTDKRSAELVYENLMLRVYMKYGLGEMHFVNEETGEIQVRKVVEDQTG